MKNLKSALSSALALSIVGSMLCVPAKVLAADADGGLQDDFETYSVSADYVTGVGSTATDGVWTMLKCGYENAGGTKIIQENGNKYLAVKGSGNTIYSSSRILINYTPTCAFLGNNVQAEADMMRNPFDSDRNQEGGLRFMVSNNEKDYYELYFGRYGGGFSLRKVANDIEKWSKNLTTFNWESGVWYSVTLANDGDALLWSVTDKSNAENSENGRIIDKDMFELRGGAAKYRLSFIGDDYIYFDNFSLNNIEPNAANYVHQSLIASDSFESYAVMAEEQHAAVETVGSNWSSSPTYKGSSWQDTYMGSQLIDTGSKVLRLKGYGSSWPGNAGCFNYVGDLSAINSYDIDDYLKMSVDVHAYSTAMPWDQKGGIRFIAHNDDRNYYALYTNGYENKTYFEKVVDGSAVVSEVVWNSLTVGEAYYNYTMEKIGNDIRCTIINKSQGVKVADYTYTDADVFDPTELNETYQLMAYNNANYCFDNFSLTAAADLYVAGREPNNILYRDIAAESVKAHNSAGKYESYTFSGSKTIRKVAAEGITAEHPISVYLVNSPNAVAEGYKLGELEADGSVLNNTLYQTGSCVVLKNDAGDSDFSINNVKILTDEDERDFTVKNKETVSLYPRLSGADCTAAWVVADTKKAVVTNGVFKAAGFGETTATAENGGNSISVNLTANPEETLYIEDFEQYETMESALQGPNKAVGDWITSNVHKAWNDGLRIQAVEDDRTGGNVLAFRGTGGSIGAVVHSLESAQQGKPFIFKADLRGTDYRAEAAGIRFCVSANEQTYYELRATGNTATPEFKKVVSGASSYSDTSANTLDNNFALHWLTFELVIDEDIITYSIKNSSGTVLWSGSYEDPSPLSVTPKISFFAKGDYFYRANNIMAGIKDDFLVYQTEPSTIMYVDAAAGKPVYSSNSNAGKLFDRDRTQTFSFGGNEVTVDMVDDYTIHRIKATGASGTIDAYVSNDKTDWYYFMQLTADNGVMDEINTFTTNSYRYIKFVSANGAANEINVLADSDEAFVRLNSKQYFAAHIDGADAADAEWSCSDDAYADVEDGVVDPLSATAAPIIITAAKGGASADVALTVADAYSIEDNENGTYTAKLGSSYYEDGASFIVVGFNASNRFAGAQKLDVGCVNSEFDAFSFTFDMIENASRIKILCWDDIASKAKPLCDSMVYVFE